MRDNLRTVRPGEQNKMCNWKEREAMGKEDLPRPQGPPMSTQPEESRASSEAHSDSSRIEQPEAKMQKGPDRELRPDQKAAMEDLKRQRLEQEDCDRRESRDAGVQQAGRYSQLAQDESDRSPDQQGDYPP